MPPVDPDLPLRQAAVARARRLTAVYDDLVPLARLREGFEFEGARVSFALQTPLVYFRALAPSQYLVIAPMFVTADDPAARVIVRRRSASLPLAAA
jgi:hypothetical protein